MSGRMNYNRINSDNNARRYGRSGGGRADVFGALNLARFDIAQNRKRQAAGRLRRRLESIRARAELMKRGRGGEV